MIAPGDALRANEPRCPAELADRHNQDSAIQPTGMDILDQGGKGLVHERGAAAHGGGKVPAGLRVDMVIPAKIALVE